MKILDGSFCIDYLNGDPATKPFYEANGSDSEQWVIPIPAYAEVVVGAGNIPEGDVDGVRSALGWAETHAIDEHTAALAGEIAAEVGPEEPFLDRPDALIAAVGRELDVPVVSADSDLTPRNKTSCHHRGVPQVAADLGTVRVGNNNRRVGVLLDIS